MVESFWSERKPTVLIKLWSSSGSAARVKRGLDKAERVKLKKKALEKWLEKGTRKSKRRRRME